GGIGGSVAGKRGDNGDGAFGEMVGSRVRCPHMRCRTWILALATWLGIGAFGSDAAKADNFIERPTAHPNYNVELEAHLAFLLRRNVAPGLGLRANWEIVDP